jgi:hypothetical protein
MKLRWIDSKGVSSHDLTQLDALLKRSDGFLWSSRLDMSC